jgi:hypothetical protein
VDRKKQASSTRALMEPEDIDPTSSPSIVKSGAHHSEKKTPPRRSRHPKTPPSSNPASRIWVFHPGVMDGWESGLHGNASKEENDALKRRRCRHQPGRADIVVFGQKKNTR